MDYMESERAKLLRRTSRGFAAQRSLWYLSKAPCHGLSVGTEFSLIFVRDCEVWVSFAKGKGEVKEATRFSLFRFLW